MKTREGDKHFKVTTNVSSFVDQMLKVKYLSSLKMQPCESLSSLFSTNPLRQLFSNFSHP